MEIRCSSQYFDYIDENASFCLNESRIPYNHHTISPSERVIWKKKDELVFESYTGTVIFHTIMWMLRAKGVDVRTVDGIGRIPIKMDSDHDILSILKDIANIEWTPSLVMTGVKERILLLTI